MTLRVAYDRADRRAQRNATIDAAVDSEFLRPVLIAAQRWYAYGTPKNPYKPGTTDHEVYNITYDHLVATWEPK